MSQNSFKYKIDNLGNGEFSFTILEQKGEIFDKLFNESKFFINGYKFYSYDCPEISIAGKYICLKGKMNYKNSDTFFCNDLNKLAELLKSLKEFSLKINEKKQNHPLTAIFL